MFNELFLRNLVNIKILGFFFLIKIIQVTNNLEVPISSQKVKDLQGDLIFFLCMTLLSDKKVLFTAFYSISLMEMNEKCSVVVANVPNELSPLFTGGASYWLV